MRSFSPVLLFLFFLLLAVPASAQEITKKRGKVTTYYPDGKKEASGKVKKYKKQGVWTYRDKTGRISKTVTYRDDVYHGLFTGYYASGAKLHEGNYVDGKYEGTWRRRYEDGKLLAEQQFSNGELHGKQQSWHPNGLLMEVAVFTSGVVGSRTTWYENGKKKSEEFYRDGAKHGAWRTWPTDAVSDTLTYTIDTYADGKRDGVHRVYIGGRLSEEAMYKNNLLNGTRKKWDGNNQLVYSENFVNGARHGKTEYFAAGLLTHHVNFENGQLHGEDIEFSPKGEKVRIAWYRHGVIDSLHKYSPGGKLAVSRVYAYYPSRENPGKTEEVSTYTEWDEKGVLLLRGKYHFETKEGVWETYYPNGRLKSATRYEGGKVKYYEKWYSNGKMLIQMYCDGNNVTAPPLVWDERGRKLKPGTKAYEELVESSRPGEVYNDPGRYRPNRTQAYAPPPPPIPPDMNDWRTYIDPPVVEETSVGFIPPVIADEDAYIEQQGDDGPVSLYEPVLPQQDDEVFTFAEEMPEFPGGTDSMKAFIQRHLVYPAGKECEGRVYIQFVVEKDGTLTNFTERKGISGCPEYSAEAIRVLRKMPNWKPAKMNGRPVRCYMTLPVKFSKE